MAHIAMYKSMESIHSHLLSSELQYRSICNTGHGYVPDYSLNEAFVTTMITHTREAGSKILAFIYFLAILRPLASEENPL